MGRATFRELKRKGFVNKRGVPTSKGEQFFRRLEKIFQEQAEQADVAQ